MASVPIPLTWKQHSPYVRGNVTYRWFEDLITGTSGGNPSADGIVSITTNLPAKSLTVEFDSNVDAVIDLAGATSTLALTVGDNLNNPFFVQVDANVLCGPDSVNAVSTVRSTLRHTFTGISDTILTSTPANPSFTEADIISSTTKSLGTFSVNDVDSPAAVYTATVTYNKALGTITYNNPGIVTENSANDQIVTSSVSTLNSVMSDMQYIPDTYLDSFGSLTFSGQTVLLQVDSTEDTRIQNKAVLITTTVNRDTALSGMANVNYTENTPSSLALSFIDSGDGNLATEEIYSLVLTWDDFGFEANVPTTTGVTVYPGVGTGEINNKSTVIQGKKTALNTALAGLEIQPGHEVLTNTQFYARLYRAPDGTSETIDITQNLGTFTKILETNKFDCHNTATVTTLLLSGGSVTLTEDDVDVALPSTTITSDSTGNVDIDFEVAVSTSVNLGNGPGEFGVISSITGGSYSGVTGKFTYTGTQSEIDAVTANLVYNPGADNTANSSLTYKITQQGETQIHTAPVSVSITPVIETGSFNRTAVSSGRTNQYEIIYDEDNILATPLPFAFSITDTDASNVTNQTGQITCNVSLSSDIGIISSSTSGLAGTFDSGTLTWTITDTVANVNLSTANLGVTIHPGTVGSTALIDLEYTDLQDSPATPVTLSGAYSIRNLRYDPIYVSSGTYTVTTSYIMTNSSNVEVYTQANPNGTYGSVTTYDFSDPANITETTTAGTVTLFPYLYDDNTSGGSILYANSSQFPNDKNWDTSVDYEQSIQWQRGTTRTGGFGSGVWQNYWYRIPDPASAVSYDVGQDVINTGTATGVSASGPYLGGDVDCVYSASQYSAENSTNFRFTDQFTLTTEIAGVSKNAWYWFGDRTSPGTAWAVASSKPNIVLHQSHLTTESTQFTGNIGPTYFDQDHVMSGDEASLQIFVAYNTSYNSGNNVDPKVYTNQSPGVGNGEPLAKGDYVVNGTTHSFASDTKWNINNNFNGNKHWAHNNHICLFDDQNRLIILKKN